MVGCLTLGRLAGGDVMEGRGFSSKFSFDVGMKAPSNQRFPESNKNA